MFDTIFHNFNVFTKFHFNENVGLNRIAYYHLIIITILTEEKNPLFSCQNLKYA